MAYITKLTSIEHCARPSSSFSIHCLTLLLLTDLALAIA